MAAWQVVRETEDLTSVIITSAFGTLRIPNLGSVEEANRHGRRIAEQIDSVEEYVL